jgi:hypothetical protein
MGFRSRGEYSYPPPELPQDLAKSWLGGWKAGQDAGSARWLELHEKLAREKASAGQLSTEISPQVRSRDFLNESAVSAVISKEAIPFPAATPYDDDPRLREAYLGGFWDAWNRVITGEILHGTFASPFNLPQDMAKSWNAGWNAGCKLGGDRWLEIEKLIRPHRPIDHMFGRD